MPIFSGGGAARDEQFLANGRLAASGASITVYRHSPDGRRVWRRASGPWPPVGGRRPPRCGPCSSAPRPAPPPAARAERNSAAVLRGTRSRRWPPSRGRGRRSCRGPAVGLPGVQLGEGPVAEAPAEAGLMSSTASRWRSARIGLEPTKAAGAQRQEDAERMGGHRQTALGVDALHGLGHRAEGRDRLAQEQADDVAAAGRDLLAHDQLEVKVTRGVRFAARAAPSIRSWSVMATRSRSVRRSIQARRSASRAVPSEYRVWRWRSACLVRRRGVSSVHRFGGQVVPDRLECAPPLLGRFRNPHFEHVRDAAATMRSARRSPVGVHSTARRVPRSVRARTAGCCPPRPALRVSRARVAGRCRRQPGRRAEEVDRERRAADVAIGGNGHQLVVAQRIADAAGGLRRGHHSRPRSSPRASR